MKVFFILASLSCVPFIAGATEADFSFFGDLANEANGTLSVLLPVLVGVALVVFIWGLIGFIQNSGDEKALSEGRQKMVWGIVGLFVIVSVWGLINLVQTLTDIKGTSSGFTAPTTPS